MFRKFSHKIKPRPGHYWHFFMGFIMIAGCHAAADKAVVFPQGGYPFATTISEQEKNFYSLPAKDSFRRSDSFTIALYGKKFHRAFHEPNLSLYPSAQPIFRLTYHGTYGYSAILRLTPESIVVKEYVSGRYTREPDTTQLDAAEKRDSFFMERNFLIEEYNGHYRNKRADSLIKRNPKLNNPGYYMYLINKSTAGIDTFTYRTWAKQISRKKFRHFANLINQSEYWQLEPFNKRCDGIATHSDLLSLETVTPNRYHVVNYVLPCEDTTKFISACEELMRFSGMDRSREAWYVRLPDSFKK